jgi:hypothetical protein
MGAFTLIAGLCCLAGIAIGVLVFALAPDPLTEE